MSMASESTWGLESLSSSERLWWRQFYRNVGEVCGRRACQVELEEVERMSAQAMDDWMHHLARVDVRKMAADCP